MGSAPPWRGPRAGAEDLNVMSFLFCLELSDIPVGPCRGLYILAAPPQVKSSSLRTLQRGGKRRRSRYQQQQRHHPVWEEPSQGSDAAAASADPFGRCMDLALGVGGGGGADSDDDDDDDYQDLQEEEALPACRRILLKERRLLNLSEREEGRVVVYLASGGYRHFIDRRLPSAPSYIFSGLHSGAGRQVHGWSNRQFTDLTLVFKADSSSSVSQICFLNHHGAFYHYQGHDETCPRHRDAATVAFQVNEATQMMDRFRMGLAYRWSNVYPQACSFRYSTTLSCDFVHGKEIPGLDSDEVTCRTLEARIEADLDRENYWLPSKAPYLNQEEIVKGIADGSLTGFVTLKGGKETAVDPRHPLVTQVTSNFGFCVQNYAPQQHEISPFTKRQIARHFKFVAVDEATGESHWDMTKVDEWLTTQPQRTLNSGTFHSEETISTTYLKWLMKVRGFQDFIVTHLALYEFRNWSGEFLKPILQTRHECKQKGDTVAAECLKLIGNGSFGYNGLESSNYSTVRIMTDESLRRQRRHNVMGTFNLKHVNLIGLVKVRQKKKRSHNRALPAAAEEDEDERQQQRRRQLQRHKRRQSAKMFFSDEAAVADDDEDEDDWDDEEEEEEDRERDNVLGLLDRLPSPAAAADDDQDDNRYEWHYRFLYTVEMSGHRRPVFNNAAKAVAILSNSKVLFFDHLHRMMSCLNPKCAELCYVDTDSCIWSLSFDSLDDCLLPDKKQEWLEADIIADESSPLSCHGKMKLEGNFRAGRFKTMKIYRLYSKDNYYTRCKGVQKAIGERLPESSFDAFADDQRRIHRTVLRPTKCGEIIVGHETRSLAIPFNLKRFVTDDGIHSFPFSSVTQLMMHNA